ncbi:MAG: ABC transporter ATP-binding protein [Treponemataceae bacterium]
MSEYLLEVKDLKMHFPIYSGILPKATGSVKAVDGVSFNIAKGEIFGLVGESGCGKSTTGRTILRLLKATGGFVSFEGKTLFDVASGQEMAHDQMRALRRDMQIIFQDPGTCLDPRMTIGNIVSEGLKEHRIARGKEALAQAKDLLELCGMNGECVRRYPHEFSGGQRQRIAIARALALHPKFLIGDEPIAALDVSIQAQVLTLMRNLKEKLGLTYLFISHDLGVVKYFCDRIAVMYLGTFIEQASSEELFAEPLHPYTRSLLSAIPKSHPKEIKERVTLKGEMPSPSNPPEGCKFHPRCPSAMPICKEMEPVYKELSGGHFVRCHLY